MLIVVVAGAHVVSAVDPLAPQDVEAGRETHSQVHSHAEQDEGIGHQGTHACRAFNFLFVVKKILLVNRV